MLTIVEYIKWIKAEWLAICASQRTEGNLLGHFHLSFEYSLQNPPANEKRLSAAEQISQPLLLTNKKQEKMYIRTNF